MSIACVILGIILGFIVVVVGMFFVWAIFGDH